MINQVDMRMYLLTNFLEELISLWMRTFSPMTAEKKMSMVKSLEPQIITSRTKTLSILKPRKTKSLANSQLKNQRSRATTSAIIKTFRDPKPKWMVIETTQTEKMKLTCSRWTLLSKELQTIFSNTRIVRVANMGWLTIKWRELLKDHSLEAFKR